jgi:hypothetical protein
MRLCRYLVTACFGVGAASGLPAQDSVRISDLQAIERAAVTYVTAVLKKEFIGFALDPRSYTSPQDRDLDDRKREAPSSSLIPEGHDDVHLRDLARRLGVAAILADTSVCVSPRPASCRFDGFSGLVSFAPLEIRGDVAQIIIRQWESSGGLRPEPGGVSVVHYRLKLIRDAFGWRVFDARIGAT